MEHVKRELGQQINEENKRINVDSAKKKAVLQRMDYDGFHQMVLGANLKTVKRGAIESIFTGQSGAPLNPHAAYASIGSFAAGYDEEVVKKLL